MKKTFTINISGSIFHIDEDAYEKLQVYLRSINAHYGASEEGREIIADIESRISEIFNETLNNTLLLCIVESKGLYTCTKILMTLTPFSRSYLSS